MTAPQPELVHQPVVNGWVAVQRLPGGSRRGFDRHASKRDAERDARRIAKRTPNVEVWVCPVVSGDIVWPPAGGNIR